MVRVSTNRHKEAGDCRQREPHIQRCWGENLWGRQSVEHRIIKSGSRENKSEDVATRKAAMRNDSSCEFESWFCH